MCEVYHVMGIVTTYGLTVALGLLAGSLASISAAGRLCEVSIHVCVLLFHLTTACIFIQRLPIICNISYFKFSSF